MTELIENVVKYWANYACGLLATLIGLLWRRVTKFKRQNEAIHNGMLSLLRDRINQACQYHLKNGYISSRDREVLNAMFDSYFNMSGNGVIKHLKVEIDALPTHVDDVH